MECFQKFRTFRKSSELTAKNRWGKIYAFPDYGSWVGETSCCKATPKLVAIHTQEKHLAHSNIIDVKAQDDAQAILQSPAPVILPHNPACGLVTEGPCNFYPRHKMPWSQPMNISTTWMSRKPNSFSPHWNCFAKLERKWITNIFKCSFIVTCNKLVCKMKWKISWQFKSVLNFQMHLPYDCVTFMPLKGSSVKISCCWMPRSGNYQRRAGEGKRPLGARGGQC